MFEKYNKWWILFVSSLQMNLDARRSQTCSSGILADTIKTFLGQFLQPPSYNIWHITWRAALFSTSSDPVLHIWPNIFGPYLAENYQLTGELLKNKQAHISDHWEGLKRRLSSKQTNFKFPTLECKKLFESPSTHHHTDNLPPQFVRLRNYFFQKVIFRNT